MAWLFGILGGWLGAIFGSIANGVLGFFAGFSVAWLIVRQSQLTKRITTLEQTLAKRAQTQTAQADRSAQATPAAASGPSAAPKTSAPPEVATPAAPAPKPPSSPALQPAVFRDPLEPLIPPLAQRASNESAPQDFLRSEIPESAQSMDPSSVNASSINTSSIDESLIDSTADTPVDENAQPTSTEPSSAWRADIPQTPPRRQPQPAAARRRINDEPSVVERFIKTLRGWLFEGNVPVKLGLLVLLFGVGALIKFAADAGWLTMPIEFRLAGIAAAAIGGLLWGLREAKQRPAFGLSVQGGAIGVLLLTVFGAYRNWQVLPAGLAFALVIALVIGAAVLAVRQNAVWLAVLGFLGGYLAPVLLSTGGGNHVALFSYYAVLNLAVFGIAWVRPWRALNLIGFVFTFVIGTAWGLRSYRPELFWTVEPFLVLFFLLYIAIPVLYAMRGRGTNGPVDGSLLFGTPLLAFPLQVALLQGERYPLAITALVMAIIYIGLALWARRDARLRLLSQSTAALGLVFAALAVPLALSARWTSAAWALQGAALLWLGLRQDHRLQRWSGIALQVLAAGAYIVSLSPYRLQEVDALAIINGHTFNLLLLSIAAMFSSWLYRLFDGIRSVLSRVFFVVAFGWWLYAGVREASLNFDIAQWGSRIAVFAALTIAVAMLLDKYLNWPRLRWPMTLAIGVLPLLALASLWQQREWIFSNGALLWVIYAVTVFLGLRYLREGEQRQIALPRLLMFAGLQIFAVLLYVGLVGISDVGIKDIRPIINGNTLTTLLLSLAAFYCSRLYQRQRGDMAVAAALLFLIGSSWWLYTGVREVTLNFEIAQWGSRVALFAALSIALAMMIDRRINWPSLRAPIAGLMMASLPLTVATSISDNDWMLSAGLLFWLPYVAAIVFGLRHLQSQWRSVLPLVHIIALAGLVYVLGDGINDRLAAFSGGSIGQGWRVTLPWLPLMALALLAGRRPQLAGWPVSLSFADYRKYVLAIGSVLLGVVWLNTQPLSGSSTPLPWLPIINPLELFQILIFIGAIAAIRQHTRRQPKDASTFWTLAALAGVLQLTVMTLRGSHHLAGLAWDMSIINQNIAQAALTVVWSLAGVLAWVLGSRRGNRPVWMLGAILLGIVMLKLLIIDRRFLGDIPGIVSFMVYGLLLVVVGRLAPIPPSAKQEPANA